MSNGAQAKTFDPDEFMRQRQGGSADFDPDSFMASRKDQSSAQAQEPTSLLGRLEKWWTTPTKDLPASRLGDLSEHPATFSTPRQRAGSTAALATTPLIAAGLATAPAATLLGLGGSAVGGTVGSAGGRYLGEQVGAPQLGEDVGGLLGSAVGGYAGAKVPGAIDKSASLLRYPATARQSQLGRPGTVKPILPSSMQRWMVPDWMIPEGELGSPTRPGPYMEIPARMPKPPAPAPEVDPVLQAVREGRAAKLPTRMPPTAPPAKPSPFAGMTPSRGPLGKAPLPQPLGRQQPDVSFVEKFTPPAKGRIVEPGSEPPRYKVTYQSVPQAELRGKVMTGDIEAIREWQRRGLDLPPNVKFMIEGGAGTQPWGGSRE